MAASQNIHSYAAAQIFYAAGSTGLQILQQVFIADTSDLLNRALLSSLPNVPFLATIWIGPSIADRIMRTSTWRWGYAIWTVVVPVAFLPLAVSLFVNTRRAARLNRLPPPVWKGLTFAAMIKRVALELDLVGLVLLSAALCLILIPLSLAAQAQHGWRNPSILAMLIIGPICACLFGLWESSKRLAPYPVLSLGLLGKRTVLAGCGIAFFYFSESTISVRESIEENRLNEHPFGQWHFIFRYSHTSIPTSRLSIISL